MIWLSCVKLVTAKRRIFWILSLLKHYLCLFFITFIAETASLQMHVIATDVGEKFLKFMAFLEVGSYKTEPYFSPLVTAETCWNVRQRICLNEYVFGYTGVQVFVCCFTSLTVSKASVEWCHDSWIVNWEVFRSKWTLPNRLPVVLKLCDFRGFITGIWSWVGPIFSVMGQLNIHEVLELAVLLPSAKVIGQNLFWQNLFSWAQ
jgi:hypothetical protein